MKRSGPSAEDWEIYERQSRICKAFAHPKRLHLLDLLAKGDCQVSDLQKKSGISKANLSQHISILRNAGIVVTKRNGKQMSCSLAMPQVKQACSLMKDVLRNRVRSDRRLGI